MIKIPVNRLAWSLLNKVPQVTKSFEYSSALSARESAIKISVNGVAWNLLNRVSQVTECQSALSARVP